MEARASRRTAFVLAAVCSLFALATPPLSAQNFGGRGSLPASQFLPANRELRQRLQGVRDAVADQRYAEAAGILGEFLLDEEFEDYFTDASGRMSLKGEAQKLLFNLPREGRESYELQFGAEARRLLETAVTERDDALLAETMRQYFPTKAGCEAAVVWARRQLDAGRPLAAAIILDRVLKTSPYAKEYEPELSLLTAIAWRLGGQTEHAQATLLAFKTRQPEASFDIAGKKITLFQDDSQALAWLDKVLGEQQIVAPHETSQWLMHRGTPDRNAMVRGSLPVATLRWHKSLGQNEADDDLLNRKAKLFQSDQIAAIPTLSPLVVNNTVLMRTPERLMAIDLASGKFVWRYPFNAPLESESAGDALSRIPAAATQRERELMQRVWEDRAYGQLASDGELVFLLSDLGYSGMSHLPTLIRRGGRGVPNPNQPGSQNKLVALSLAQQGKARWMVGGETGEAEEKLAGAFFLGVPLVHDGSLYAIIELNGELRLVVLDPATGKLRWSQQLAHVEAGTLPAIISDSTRRLAGATPSLASGVLVCPTMANTVVAVDLAERKLLWGYQYEPLPNRGWGPFMQPPRPIGSFWLDATATIADGKVLLTPSDSEYLFCLDLITGKEAWKPLRRADALADMLYVATVQDGKIVLVGRNRITAIHLADGRPAWNAAIELNPGEMPSGRGFASAGYYYLPTSHAQLLKIDLAEGRIAQRVTSPRVLGNLVAYKDQLVSQNHDGVTSFYQSEALRLQVAERLQANPEDPTALAQRAQLELYDNQPAAALATLRKAYQLDRTNDDTRALLVQTLLDALKRDFASYQTLASEIEPLLDQPQQRREFLRLKAQGLQQAGDIVAAFTTYATLAGYEISERPDSSAMPNLETIEPQLRVRSDRWVQARLQELYLAHAAERPQMQQAMDTVLKNLPATLTTEQQLRVLNFFGWHPHSDRARLELASARWDAGELLAAEVLLTKFGQQVEGETAGRATALLAAVYEKAGRTELAAQHYARLGQHFADVPVRGQTTGREVYASALQQAAFKSHLTVPGQWRGGEVQMREGGDVVAGSGFATAQRPHSMSIQHAIGALDDGSALLLSGQRIALRDRLGNEWNEVMLSRPETRTLRNTWPTTTHGHLLGHLALVSVGQDVWALDLLERQDSVDAMRWRQDLLPATADGVAVARMVRSQTVAFPWSLPRTIATTQPDIQVGGIASLSERAVCLMRWREVICIDPLTGETLWERSQLPPGSELFGDEELLFVVPPRSAEALVFSVADGRELGKRKVESIDNRWTTLGRNVLACRQEGTEFVARLFNAESQETLWEAKFPFGTRGTLIGRDEMAMMQLDGTFTLVSLVDGRVKLSTQLEPEPKLMNIHVLRSSSQYLVQMETIINGKDALPNMNVQAVPSGEASRSVTGRLYALDRHTLKPAWPSPAYISQHGWPLDQAPDLPLLMYLRRLSPNSTNGPTQPRTGVLVLDRRDGRMLLERDNIRIESANAYEFSGSLTDQEVTLTISTGRGSASGKTFSFRFTDDPTPPAPPAATGAMSSLSGSPASGGMWRAIGRVLGEANGDSSKPTPPQFPRLENFPVPFPPGFPPGVPGLPR